MSKWLPTLFALVLVAFGVGCLNYTAFGNSEHHIEWAAERGLPPPSFAVFVTGAACLFFGAATLGFKLGARRAK